MSNENDDELPEDEEEILVYVEFDGSVASNSLSNEKLQLDMIGLDMEHPIMQVNGKFYEGTYHDAVGTYMFFEGDEHPHVDDPVFDVTPTLKYFAKTRKVLKMKRIFVELKTEMFGDSNDPACVPSRENIEKSGIPPRYQEGALRSWEKMREDRIKALNDYLEKQRVRDEKRSQGIEPDSDSDDDNPFAIYKPEVKQKRTVQSDNRSNPLSEESGNSTDDGTTGSKTLEASESAIEPDLRVSTVIDPGPSTSKDSKPWKSPPIEKISENLSISDSNEDTYHVNLPNVKGAHEATVRVTRRAKIRKYGRKLAGKKSNKTMNRAVESSDREMMNLEENNGTDSSRVDGNTRLEEESTRGEDNEKDIEETLGTMESMKSLLISQSTEESPKNTDTDTPDNIESLESTIDKRNRGKRQKRDEKMRDITIKLKKAADELRLKNQQRSEDSV